MRLQGRTIEGFPDFNKDRINLPIGTIIKLNENFLGTGCRNVSTMNLFLQPLSLESPAGEVGETQL